MLTWSGTAEFSASLASIFHPVWHPGPASGASRGDTPLIHRDRGIWPRYAGRQWQPRMPRFRTAIAHVGAVMKDKGPRDSRAIGLLRLLAGAWDLPEGAPR